MISTHQYFQTRLELTSRHGKVFTGIRLSDNSARDSINKAEKGECRIINRFLIEMNKISTLYNITTTKRISAYLCVCTHVCARMCVRVCTDRHRR